MTRPSLAWPRATFMITSLQMDIKIEGITEES